MAVNEPAALPANDGVEQQQQRQQGEQKEAANCDSEGKQQSAERGVQFSEMRGPEGDDFFRSNQYMFPLCPALDLLYFSITNKRVTNMEESIYNIVPKEFVPPAKEPIYRSKFPPNIPPTGSTFGNHTTSKPHVFSTLLREPTCQESSLGAYKLTLNLGRPRHSATLRMTESLTLKIT